MSEKHFLYRNSADERNYERTHLDIEEASRRAQKTLSEYEIKLEIFSGLYGEDGLKHDAKEVERLEGLFEPSPSKIHADILEAIMCEHGELSEWFGPRSEVIKTSRFDDYKNKIDMIVETETEDRRFSHLALGIDVTFGSKDLSKKFDAIRKNIENGKLAEIKYFHSDRQHFTGRLRNVPRVVVGVELERVRELGLLWMNRRNKELALHPVQSTILEETALQLHTFAEYAAAIGRNDLVPILEQEFRKIKDLLDEKKKNGIQSLPHDKVFEEIKRNLLSFTTTSA